MPRNVWFVPFILNKKFELRLTKQAKAYSSSCSQTVSLSPATSSHSWTHSWTVHCSRIKTPYFDYERLVNNGKVTTFTEYLSLMPSCAGFLEPRKSRFAQSKSSFNAENSRRSFSMAVSIDLGTIRS